MRRRWLEAAALLAMLSLLGFAVAASGIVPIKASSGHWALTRWFLQFSKQRSVATHTLGGKPLELGEPWLVLKGAGLYHSGCLPCHGGPDRSYFPHVARSMTPTPPDLRSSGSAWDADELFYIVKHGIKLTGMPAWPAQQRDDEVRALVAFVQALPGLEPVEYRRLVLGDLDPTHAAVLDPMRTERTAATALANCARCHGADGHGRGSAAFPKLAGQSPEYLEASLQAFANGERHSGVMAPLAASLSADEMRALAEHFGGLPTGKPSEPAPMGEAAAAVERGREIAAEGIPAQRVASCIDCHGPGVGRGNPAYPSLAGQYADYLALQLELFQAEQRGGSPHARLMSAVAPRLTREQMRDVAHYYASLPLEEPR